MSAKLSKEQLEEIQNYLQTLPEEEREEKLNEIMSKLETQAPQCPFCLMGEGKIKTTKVYDDASYCAVLEINPATEGHTILFTKKHNTTLCENSTSDIENLFKIAKIMSQAISSFSDGITIYTEDGNLPGRRFDHFVINIIPRYKDDDVNLVTKPSPASLEKLNETREKILKNLPKEEKEQTKQDDSLFPKELKRIAGRMP